MAWSRFDDGFYDHPKILGLSHPAFRLCVCAITYSSRHNTGGALAKPQVAALCRLLDVPAKAAKELVEAGCWHETPDGYRIHDYEKYHPKDATNNERQQRYREAQRNGHSNGNVTGETVTDNGDITPQLPLSQSLRNGASRGATRAEPDPTRPDPDPSQDTYASTTTNRPGGQGESSGQSSSKNGHRPENPTVLAFIQKTLAENPGWDAVLTVEERSQSVRRLVPWQRSVLQAWLDGDGVPTPERIAECQRILAVERGEMPPDPTPAAAQRDTSRSAASTSPYPPARKLDYPVIAPEKAAENSRRLRENSARLAAKMTGNLPPTAGNGAAS